MYIIAVIVIIIFLVVGMNIRNTLQMKEKIRQRFGKEKGDFKYEDDIKTISYYYNCKKSDKDIDDITWNDLDMNRIYNDMNTTQTNAGEEYLYALLHRLEYGNTLLEERERVTKILDENEEIRIKLQIIFYELRKVYNSSMYETLDEFVDTGIWKPVIDS